LTISSDVQEICAEFVSLISGDGELKHPIRRRLHSEIERLTGRDEWNSYIELSKACAVKAWPVWRARYDEDLPSAGPVPGATPERPELRLTESPQLLGSLATFLDNVMREGPDAFPAGSAGLACWATNRDYLAQAFLSPPDRDEADIYPEDWEASLYASMAISGGPVWEPAGDVEKRRRFWTWYLEEAVPRCYVPRPEVE
jgi:hypothetical protein